MPRQGRGAGPGAPDAACGLPEVGQGSRLPAAFPGIGVRNVFPDSVVVAREETSSCA